MTDTILRIDASSRTDASISRNLADTLMRRLDTQDQTSVIRRDLATTPASIVDDRWVRANFTRPEDRSDADRAVLAESDALVEELRAADTIVLAVPVYNFNLPAALKAWIDQICRAGVTFRYTEDGPVGLLERKKAYVIVVSGGVPLGSAADFLSGYLRHILGFIGIGDITFIDGSGQAVRGESAIEEARAEIASLTLAA